MWLLGPLLLTSFPSVCGADAISVQFVTISYAGVIACFSVGSGLTFQAIEAVPEPGTLLLVWTGMAAAAARIRKRFQNSFG